MASDQTSGLTRFLAEARRRHVVRFMLAYAAAAFVVLQLAEIVFPAFGIGEGGLRVLVVLTGLGFIPALVLAWIYDLSTEGITRTESGPDPLAAVPSRLALSALAFVTIAVTGGLALYLVNQGVLDPSTPVAPSIDGAVSPVAYVPGEPIRSLAVLPLDDFSADADQAYFTRGMHEELIAKLSLLEGLRVVSRTTVMRYADPDARPSAPEIGRALGVDALVEGSVSRSGDQVRVTLQIIHAPSDSHIQTLQWEREDVQDVLAFQTEIAHAVAEQIAADHAAAFEDAVPVASVEPEAQEDYLRARHEYARGTEEGYRAALQYFESALDQDPDFAAALAGAAGARFLIGLDDSIGQAEQVAMAHDEALRALSMDSTSMEAKEVLGFIERGMPVVVSIPAPPAPADADPQVRTSIRVMDAGGEVLNVETVTIDTAWAAAMTSLGERIEARVRERALRLGEIDPARRRTLEAGALFSAGRFNDAARILQEAVDEDPGHVVAWDMLLRARVAVGDLDGAVQTVRAWSAADGHGPGRPSPEQATALAEGVDRSGEEGFWAWQLERLERRRATGENVALVELAAAHAGVGDEDQALSLLELALERREPGVQSLRADPVWDDLRGDRRFRRLARQAQDSRFDPIIRRLSGR